MDYQVKTNHTLVQPLILIFLLVQLLNGARGLAGTQSVKVIVPGTADPWLAGMPDGSTASENPDGSTIDIAPAQSPAQVFGLHFVAGSEVTFNATGYVKHSPALPYNQPNGDPSSITSHLAGAEHGISNINAPFNCLLGVFLDPGRPDASPAPVPLEFNLPTSRNYVTLRPELKQVFFIGDGTNGHGDARSVVVPPGATRLFLGTMDSFEWNNNGGHFDVIVSLQDAPPVVAITAPTNGAMIVAGTSIQISASAADTDGSVTNVAFYVNGTNALGSLSSAPFGLVWTNVSPGSYSLIASATDDMGLSTTSDRVNITVTAPVLSLTVTGITASNKVYNGTIAATLNLGGAGLNGVLPADAGNVAPVTSNANGAFADPNVGTGKAVTITGLALSGSAASHYILMQPTTTASITPLALVLTGITASSKDYDGTVAASLNVGGASLNGVLQLDAEKVSLVTSNASGTFADPNVGMNKVVTVTRLTLSGSAASNYALTLPSPTANIMPAKLLVAANNTSRTYGGTNPVFTASITGFVNGENRPAVVTGVPSFTTSASTVSPVGAYAIVPELGSLQATNYSFGLFVIGTLTVLPAPLMVTADNKGRPFGTPNPTFTGTVTGLQNNDPITASYNCSATISSPAGTYPIVPTLVDPTSRLPNYTVTTNLGTLTVTEAVAPTVQITVPTNRTVFVTNELIQIEASVVDPQHRLQRVEFYASGQPLGAVSGLPYRLLWSGAALGRYDLVAQAVDQQSNVVSSVPVAIVVSDACGQAAIVRNFAHPEIDKLQDYLFEVGVGGQVFDHGGVTPEQLAPFRVVIWNDLGVAGLTDADVNLFSYLFQTGVSLYLIGEDLVGSAGGLSGGTQNQWLNLVHLKPSGSAGVAGPVTLDRSSAYPTVLRGNAGDVADFSSGAIAQPGIADGASSETVLGRQGGQDVLLVYEDQANRLVTQTFGVWGGTDPASLTARQTLFENAVRWLLRCEQCGDVTLKIAATATPAALNVGQEQAYTITVAGTGGECDALMAVVTVLLPVGLQFLSAESTNGAGAYADGVVRFHLERVSRDPAKSAQMVIRVRPTQPGTFTNSCAVSASNSPRSYEADLVTQVTTDQPLLGLSAPPGQTAAVSIIGPVGRQCVLEASTNLVNWIPVWTNALTNLPIKWQEPQQATAKQRFFRARLAP